MGVKKLNLYCAEESNGFDSEVDLMSVEFLLQSWWRRARESQTAHYRTARNLSHLNYRLGIPTVVLAAVVGTSIFASLETTPSISIKIVFGVVSLGTAALSAIQTFLRFAERAEKHRAAGAAFGALRREIEQWQALPRTSEEQLVPFVDGLRKRFDELALHSPEIPARVWSDVEEILAKVVDDRAEPPAASVVERGQGTVQVKELLAPNPADQADS